MSLRLVFLPLTARKQSKMSEPAVRRHQDTRAVCLEEVEMGQSLEEEGEICREHVSRILHCTSAG